MPGPAARDLRCDPATAKLAPVLVVVIATVGQQPIGLLAWPSDLAGDRTPVEVFDQREQLGDVVALPAGEGDR